jgi:TolB protein
VWLPNSRGLLYVSNQDGGRDVYFVPLSRSGAPAAPPTRVTTGLQPHTMALSADGRRLVYALLTESANVVAVSLQPGRSVSLREARPITTGSQQVEGFSISPDGRWLAFDSDRNGNQDIWRMPLDRSTPPEPLSTGPEDEFQPSYTPDGKLVGFHATRSGSLRDLYLVPAQGGGRTRVEVQTQNNLAPQFSPDGRSVLFMVWGPDGTPSIHAARRPVRDSGWTRATPLFTIAGGSGQWSPDGKQIVYVQPAGVFRADADGGHSQRIATLPTDFTPFYIRWSQDGRSIYYSGLNADGTYLIYAVPASGGRPRQVAHSEGPSYQNFRFSFQVHGSTLYTSLADRQSDIWVAEVAAK